MAAMGRPPKPAEIKRRNGNPGKRPLAILADVVALPMADGVPLIPPGIESAGADLWRELWQDGITWISPKTDMAAVTEACQAADDVAVARRRYRATSDPADARALATLGKRLDDALSTLGFNPTARSRLGVAEVRRASALEKLLERRHG